MVSDQLRTKDRTAEIRYHFRQYGVCLQSYGKGSGRMISTNCCILETDKCSFPDNASSGEQQCCLQ